MTPPTFPVPPRKAKRPHCYSVYGITLNCELCLSLPRAKRENGADVALTLEVAESHAFQSLLRALPLDSQDWFQHAVLENGNLYVRLKDWFDFLVSSDGRCILCRNLSNVALESFEAYLTNFAVSAALVQRGEEPLHSTVVEINGRTIGLLGASGAGKSTLASYLLHRGAELVTDDMLRVTFEGANAIAHPGPYRLKLFKEPADRYLRSAASAGSWIPFGDKLIYELGNPKKARRARRLSALYQLAGPVRESDQGVVLERLAGVELFKTISASTMNTRLHTPARLARQFRFAERIARMLPVYRLTYPRNFEFLSQVAEQIYQSAPT
jgi:predicted DCC family thiol-disulfide oxidoreductase YuxK